ncbi:hypothetical protein EV360DRAFT_57592 [Lentinula raphanica]|nr:hypothetical protein EV360DRAFT_57592 [Lentinula raphanica]
MARSQSTIPETQVATQSTESSISSDPVPSTPAPKKRPAPASMVSYSSKRVKSSNSQTDAVNGLSSALGRFGENFVEGANTLAAAINGSPARKARTKEARDTLFQKEDWLALRHRIELGNRFIDHQKAEAYLYVAGLDSPSRQTWVVMELDVEDEYPWVGLDKNSAH